MKHDKERNSNQTLNRPMVDTDICVIGAGIMGSSTAYWLTKTSRHKILLIDQYTISNNYCSSNDTNRVFRYAYGTNNTYTDMAVTSHQLWKNLEHETGETILISTGLLMLTGEDAESNQFNKNSYHTLTKKSLSAEWLDATELKTRYPQFTAEEAILDKNGGVLLASKCLTVFNSQATKRGLRVLENTQARSIKSESHLTIETSQGEIKCQTAIVTAGPWSNQLRPESMVNITPTRQQVVYFDPGPDIDTYRPSKLPVFFADQHYGLPAAGIDAVKVSHKGVWNPVQPDKVNRAVDPAEVEECRQACRHFIPALAEQPVKTAKACLYDMTKDSDFAIGPDPTNHQLLYGYGFSGHGFKFAILIGKLLAELALGKPASIDLEQFSPTRTPSMLMEPVA